MKNLSLLLFLSAFLLLTTRSFAQSSDQSEQTFFVGTHSLEEIEEKLVEVRFHGWRKPFNMLIYYGQDCMDNFGLLNGWTSRTLREDCIGLKDKYGDLVDFNHYMTGLNFMEKMGFELLEIIPTQDSEVIHTSSFIFKRKPKDLK